MSAEMAEQPAVLASLLERREEIRARVRPLADPEPPGIVLVARGSSDNAAVYGRYLLELVVGQPELEQELHGRGAPPGLSKVTPTR